jgi:hypothetical protein
MLETLWAGEVSQLDGAVRRLLSVLDEQSSLHR